MTASFWGSKAIASYFDGMAYPFKWIPLSTKGLVLNILQWMGDLSRPLCLVIALSVWVTINKKAFLRSPAETRFGMSLKYVANCIVFVYSDG